MRQEVDKKEEGSWSVVFGYLLGRAKKWLGSPGAGPLIALVALLVSINAIGIWGIVYSGREARQEVLKDLQLQAFAGARSLEAILASTRADFVFLAQSPPFSSLRTSFENADPMARRWQRIDAEATLLLFLTSHPEVERITLLFNETPFLTAGRRGGAPVVLPSSEATREAVSDPESQILGRWTLGEQDSEDYIEALLSVPELLTLASPSQDYSLALRPFSELEVEAEEDSAEVVVVPVRDPAWSPPIDWAIIWSERRTGLVQSVTRLTERYSITLAVNVGLLILAAIVGVIAVRQVRRGVALEIKHRQQEQVRELERQLMHTERLATVGRMAAGLAHEINNPLEGMANYLLLIEDDIRNKHLDSGLKFIGKVQEGLRRAAGVTKRALAFADPGQKPNTSVDIQQIMAETLDFVRATSLFKDVEVTIIEADQQLVVLGNPVTLGQAFLNLLLNAAEIQRGSGSIEISFEVANGYVVVNVADRGPGIPDEILDRIFEPFYSGRGSTGLGLSICQTIAVNHDGQIEAANRPGGGAVFRMRVPLEKSRGRVEPAMAGAKNREVHGR